MIAVVKGYKSAPEFPLSTLYFCKIRLTVSLIVLNLLPWFLLRQWYTFLCLLGCHFPWQVFSYFKFVTKPCMNSIFPQEYFSMLLMCTPWIFRTGTKISIISTISKGKCTYSHQNVGHSLLRSTLKTLLPKITNVVGKLHIHVEFILYFVD